MRERLSGRYQTLLLLLLFALSAFAQEENKTELTLPWSEFKKIINIDDDQIAMSMASYHKLLKQSGQLPANTAVGSGGNVVLTRSEFQKLVNQMKQPGTATGSAPFKYLVTKAVYSGSMQSSNTRFTGTFNVHVLEKNGYLKVPLLAQHIALEDIRLNGKPALVVSEGGYHQVVIEGAGEHQVTVRFSVKSAIERGPHKLDLNVQRTPITLLTLDIPLTDIDVEIPQSQQLSTAKVSNKTQVSAVIAPGNHISVRWRKKVEAAEKVPAKLYADIYNLISIEDDVLQVRSAVNYKILHSEVDAVRIALPAGINILSVTGEAVGEWHEADIDGQRILVVPFTYSKMGNVRLEIKTETALSENGLSNAFLGIRAVDIVRETGFIGIELNTSAEVLVAESDGLEAVPPQKLPSGLINMSAKPLMMGFKYLKHPYNLLLDIKKHEKIAVPIATVHSANAVTLFTEDGKIVHRLSYQIRNSAKQFLQVQLPEGADVWSVFVDNKPVESSINGNEQLLVPLIRSRSSNNQLATFPVEVIYAEAETGFSWLGRRNAELPTIDLLVSQMLWSVYLPNDYSYMYFNSTLEKEEIIRGINLFGAEQRRYDAKEMKKITGGDNSLLGYFSDVAESPQVASRQAEAEQALEKAYKGSGHRSQFRNLEMDDARMNAQIANELQFSGALDQLAANEPQATKPQNGGHLPVMIRVPTSGQVYRFARTIIRSDDALSMEVHYAQFGLLEVLRWIAYVLLALLVWRNRNRLKLLWRKVTDFASILVSWWKANGETIFRMSKSPMTIVVVLGLLLISWPYSEFLTLALLFALWVLVLQRIIESRRAKREKMPNTPPAAAAEGDIVIEE